MPLVGESARSNRRFFMSRLPREALIALSIDQSVGVGRCRPFHVKRNTLSPELESSVAPEVCLAQRFTHMFPRVMSCSVTQAFSVRSCAVSSYTRSNSGRSL